MPVNTPVPLYTRIIGKQIATYPKINANNITIGAPFTGSCYMIYPAGQGDLVWQGTAFGLSAPNSGGGLVPNIWQVKVTFQHQESSPSDFASVTGQIYDTNTSTVVASGPLTLSSSFITETVTLSTGYPAADVSHLAGRLVYHAIRPGVVSVPSGLC